jgi:hypothetical protein
MNSHVSDDVREEFCQVVDSARPNTYPFTEALLTKVQDCTDTLPAGVCDRLDIGDGSSYADAVRKIRSKIGVVLAPPPIEHRGSMLKNTPVESTDRRAKR